MKTDNRCPFCCEQITADNPLRFSGQHDLGCADCYRSAPLTVARQVRPVSGHFTLGRAA